MKKRKDGYYTVSRTIDGERKFFYGHSKQEAMRKASEFIEETERERTLFSSIAAKWKEDHFPTLAWNTLKQYKPAYERAVAEFGEEDITEITPGDIAAYIKEFAKGRADKTVRTQLMVISLIFRYAINFCGINIPNPARDITVPKHLKKDKILPPSSDDIARIKAAVDEPFGLFFYMAIYTGLRKGELLALEWKDISKKDRTITVSKSLYHVNNKPQVKTPKTERGSRTVPIVDALLPYLKKKRGLVFPNSQGKYMTETQYQKALEDYRRASGVQCTAHQLRHLYATMLYENNIPVMDAMYLLGHSQAQTTQDVYTAIRESHVRKIQESVYSIDVV